LGRSERLHISDKLYTDMARAAAHDADLVRSAGSPQLKRAVMAPTTYEILGMEGQEAALMDILKTWQFE
jgi:hypothetical protein